MQGHRTIEIHEQGRNQLEARIRQLKQSILAAGGCLCGINYATSDAAEASALVRYVEIRTAGERGL